MDVATRRAAYIWALLALLAETTLAARGWPALLWLTVGAMVLSAAASILSRWAVAAVLFFTYITPAVLQLTHGDVHAFFSVIWFGALLGAMLPGAIGGGWAVPRPWRLPLVLWVFTIAIAVPIITAREIDFNAVLLFRDRLPSESLGGLPAYSATWILHVGLGQVLGILWFDWLFGQPREATTLRVAAPLACGAVCMMLAAIYQAFFDVTWLNATAFGAMGRAAGTLFDANLCGAIAAIWIGVAALPALIDPARYQWISMAGGLLGWGTVLATGSRTAQVAAVIISAFVLAGLMVRASARPSRAVLAVVLPATVVLVAALLFLGSLGIGPIGRLWESLPSSSAASWRQFALELWNRNGYGRAASDILREYPLFGVGLGSFETMLLYFAPGLIPDNAQNWYRHMVAELGLVGASGPLLWTILFGWFVVRGRQHATATLWPLRGVLVAFALVALVGMPGQDLTVALTFWTVAFWFASAVGDVERGGRTSWPAWAAVAAVLAIFTAGTMRLADGELRPPVRSERIGWPYSYGFYAAERNGDGAEFRWAQRRAVMVLDAPRRTIDLTTQILHADIGARPVRLQAWVDDAKVVDRVVKSTDPSTVTVAIPEGRPYVRVELHASREVVPADTGLPDERHLAARVSWEFKGAENAARLPLRDLLGRTLQVTSFYPDVKLPAPAGSPMFWTVLTAGGAGPFSYRFSASDGVKTTQSDWGPIDSWLWIPPRPGSYDVEVQVRNAGSTGAADATLRESAVIDAPNRLTVTEVTSSASNPVAVGDAVAVRATTFGSTVAPEYMFIVSDGTEWTTGRDWGSSADWIWTPEKSGRYTIQAEARMAGSRGGPETWRQLPPLVVTDPQVLTVTKVASSSASIVGGESVTWSASAAGGTAPYSYQFEAFDGNRLLDSRQWGSSNTWTWTPLHTGDLSVRASVRDSISPVTATRQSAPLRVTAPATLTLLASVQSAPLPKAGTPVLFRVGALGGTAPHMYRFWVVDGDDWTVARDWAAADTWQWTPPHAGTYRFVVWVRNAGSSAEYDAWTGAGPLTVSN